jgi:salicylate hydroxylase
MTRVAIIGGGIGGLTAANALSRAGIETAVYEAAAELREIGAGVALHPNAMKVLRAIGVEDGVRTVAEQPPDLAVGRLAARPDDRLAAAGEPARPGGARRGLARRLRRELAGRARRLSASPSSASGPGSS